MSLERRGSVWHFDFQLAGERYRGTTGATSKAGAREVETQAKRRAIQQQRDRLSLGEAPAIVTLAHASALRWTARMEGRRSVRTASMRLENLRRCIDFDMDVRDVTTAIVADAIARRRGEPHYAGRALTNATVNRDIIATLRPILRYAGKVMGVRGMADIDWAELRLPEPRGRTREFTADELARIRAGLASTPHHRDLFDFLCHFGLRLREAWMPLDRIDLSGKGRLLLRERKAGDWHSVPLGPKWRRWVAARVSRARQAGLDTIWYWERRTKAGVELRAMSPWSFQTHMRVVLDRLKIANCRPAHDWRHHAGTTAMRRSRNIRAVQKLLGHASIVSTARYAHASEDDVLAALGESPQKSPQKPKRAAKSLISKGA